MAKGKISETISAQAITAIQAAVQTIRANVPFLLALSPEERKGMLKLGPKSVKFVSGVKQVVQAHPDLVPGAIDVSELIKDAELVEALNHFQPELSQVAEGSRTRA